MIAFIEDNRLSFGVEPICKVLPIAPSTYYDRAVIARDPTRASDRAKSDANMCSEISRVFDANRRVYGARKIWHALRREGHDVARCTVERLMRKLGLKGVMSGKKTNCLDLQKANLEFLSQRPKLHHLV